jgi:hypothetical protein
MLSEIGLPDFAELWGPIPVVETAGAACLFMGSTF